MSVVSSWYLPFLVLPYLPFQKTEIWLSSNWSRWNFKRACNLKLVFQIIQKMTEKYCPWFYVSINQVWLVKELWFKWFFQNYTHHDITDLVNYEMIKKIKTWICWEWNMTFLWNKRNLNLCLRWQIFRSYCFAAEVTFNML